MEELFVGEKKKWKKTTDYKTVVVKWKRRIPALGRTGRTALTNRKPDPEGGGGGQSRLHIMEHAMFVYIYRIRPALRA